MEGSPDDRLFERVSGLWRAGVRRKLPDPLGIPLLVDDARWGPEHGGLTPEQAKYRKAIDNEFQFRRFLVFRLFGIAPDPVNPSKANQDLLEQLVSKFIPGMRLSFKSQKRGREPERDAAFYDDLYQSVNKARADLALQMGLSVPEITISQSIESMDAATRGRFRTPSGELLSTKKLRNEFHRAKSAIIAARREDELLAALVNG